MQYALVAVIAMAALSWPALARAAPAPGEVVTLRRQVDRLGGQVATLTAEVGLLRRELARKDRQAAARDRAIDLLRRELVAAKSPTELRVRPGRLRALGPSLRPQDYETDGFGAGAG